jgi:predicted HTH domain antitoxin
MPQFFQGVNENFLRYCLNCFNKGEIYKYLRKDTKKIQQYVKVPIDNKFMLESLVVELYREGALTLRQASELLDADLSEIFDSMRKTYINYGEEELAEDIEYVHSK